jgi:enediyne polyketide synthase
MTMTPAIAIVGVACRYPDARSPLELWENVLAGRRAFRRLPRERLPLDDYASRDRSAPDVAYDTRAAVLDGYHFDRVRFRVSAATFKSVDLVHWLALDVASQALADAGFADSPDLPRTTTGVLIGNTLTGEFSRAGNLRLRWPYVRRVIDAALERDGEPADRRKALLPHIESLYKAPFAPVDGETLAGSLSNTIAGRICNYFDLKGGGYTVDGACASSLLAVTQACSALSSGDLDVALAGGVDLSLDPFELVGFAKAGALASEAMRVYDNAPTGFWPGEGCGFVVLMRESDALAVGRRVYAVIRGWGVSSDGNGGMTRPEREGQVLAIERAYARAGIGIESVRCFEGHGTGTAVGDATELAALSEVRRRSGQKGAPAAIGSIKANVGHTKAAAGIAGLLKATLAVQRQLIPPTTGCSDPHALVSAPDSELCVPDCALPWPVHGPRRAGVSAMGFGGINVHVVLEGREDADTTIPAHDRDLLCARAAQDAELVALSANDWPDLLRQLDELATVAGDLSIAELTDLAVHQQRTATPGPVRAAIIASTPDELADRLRRARAAVETRQPLFNVRGGIFVAASRHRPRIGFLFPGQGAPVRTDGGCWSRKYPEIEDLYRRATLPSAADPTDTRVAQPAIVTGCIAGVGVLRSVGIDGALAIGHSLGELAALWWSDALAEEHAIALASQRARLMAEHASGPGRMAVLGCPVNRARSLIDGTAVEVAAINAPDQVTVSGAADEIEYVCSRARDRAISASTLPVSYAFHSSLMKPVAPGLRDFLQRIPFGAPTRPVISTVSGRTVGNHDEIPSLLERQITEPVLFAESLRAAGAVDLFIEAGPGHTLSALVSASTRVPAVSVDAGGHSVKGLLTTVAAAFTLGAPVNLARLAQDRFARPFSVDLRRDFLVNPCELAAGAHVSGVTSATTMTVPRDDGAAEDTEQHADQDTCSVLRLLVARASDLPLETVHPNARFLTDLHLNSLTVSELLAKTAKRIGGVPPFAPTDYADATIAEAAQALDELRSAGAVPVSHEIAPDGIDTWVRAFTVVNHAESLPTAAPVGRRGTWQIVSSPQHPLREALLRRFADDAGGPGVVVCLDSGFPHSVSLLLDAAQAALRQRLHGKFVVVQERPVASGFARTLFLESTSLDVCVVTVDALRLDADALVHAEASHAEGFVEARYDADGRRLVPLAVMTPLEPATDAVTLGPSDVLLVTGGGKGISAECALTLARDTGVKLALLGRSRPESDDVLAANLDRLRKRGAMVHYVVADVTSPHQVRRAIDAIREELGEVTAVLHAAAVNTPGLIPSLDEEAISAAIRPKVNGARNVLAAVDPARLRLFISFGSVIARTGLPGEAHYALANDLLRELTTQMAATMTGCRAITIEWSVWAAVGMGERLGRLGSLERLGVAPITIEDGTAILRTVLNARLPSASVLITGRFNERSQWRLASSPLPFSRFLESPRVHYAGIELVADANVSTATDPYVTDHRIHNQLLFPGVMGIEAMVQAAMAVRGTSELPTVQSVEFARPIVVPDEGSLVLRTMALADTDGRVRVALRTDTTGFMVDHFRAVCSWPDVIRERQIRDVASAPQESIDVDPATDLYGTLLFQSGRFARVRRYHRLLATECVADLKDETATWFGPYLPDSLALGDPGLHDAVIHCVQASIPHRRVVPVSVDRIVARKPLRGPCRVYGRERFATGDEFTWDISVINAAGDIVESWDAVRFRGIASLPVPRKRAALLIPYLQRQLATFGHPSILKVGVSPNGPGRRHGPRAHRKEQIRPDGMRDRVNGIAVSTAYAGRLTMRIEAADSIGCDLEPVVGRSSDVWQELLGTDLAALTDLIARERHETHDASATRVWAAMESLKKAGAGPNTPLVFGGAPDDGWVTLRAGHYVVSTWIGDVEQHDQIAIAVATGEVHAVV